MADETNDHPMEIEIAFVDSISNDESLWQLEACKIELG